MFRASQFSSRQTRRVFGWEEGKEVTTDVGLVVVVVLQSNFIFRGQFSPITWQCVRLEGGGGGKVHPPLHRLKQAVGSLCQKRLPPPPPHIPHCLTPLPSTCTAFKPKASRKNPELAVNLVYIVVLTSYPLFLCARMYSGHCTLCSTFYNCFYTRFFALQIFL